MPLIFQNQKTACMQYMFQFFNLVPENIYQLQLERGGPQIIQFHRPNTVNNLQVQVEGRGPNNSQIGQSGSLSTNSNSYLSSSSDEDRIN